MRRSGSSSCLLRPRSSLSSEDLKKMEEEPPLAVTMVNTTRLPAYSTERYYMLSELEQNAHSVKFLCDIAKEGNDGGADLSSNSTTLPPYMVLYVLWRPNTYPSPRSFAEGPVLDYVRRILTLGGDDAAALLLENTPSPTSSPLSGGEKVVAGINTSMGRRASFSRRESWKESSEPRTKIYLVVDRVSPPPTSPLARNDLLPDQDMSEATESEDQQQLPRAIVNDEIRQRQHKVETQISEDVAKVIARNPSLRPVVQGISIGTTAEVRAAPGLEACLEAIGHLSAERRRAGRYLVGRDLHDYRSPICLVAPHPDDLVGLDPEGEADAVQGVVQSRTVAEWNGNGDSICFATRAMEGWRKAHGLESLTSGFSKGSSSRSMRRKKGDTEETDPYESGGSVDADEIAQTMVVALFIAVAAFLWTRHRDSIWGAVAEFVRRYGQV